MKNTLLCLTLSLTASSCLAVGFPETIEEIPMKDCNLNMIKDVIEFNNIHRQGDLAGQQKPLIAQMRAVTSKATISGVAVGDQLSTADLVKFTEIRQKMLAIEYLQHIESNRVRDVEIVINLVQVADKNYRWNTEVQEGNPDYIYQAGLSLMRLANANPDITTPPVNRSCTIELALHVLEDESTSKFNAIDTTRGHETLQAIRKKYNMQKIDRPKLSAADQNTYDMIMNDVITPANREIQFMSDIENIKYVAKAAELIYETSKVDLANSGGDYAAVGQTIAKKAEKKEFSDPMTIGIGVLRKIGEKIPSEATKLITEAAKYADRVNAEYPVKTQK